MKKIKYNIIYRPTLTINIALFFAPVIMIGILLILKFSVDFPKETFNILVILIIIIIFYDIVVTLVMFLKWIVIDESGVKRRNVFITLKKLVWPEIKYIYLHEWTNIEGQLVKKIYFVEKKEDIVMKSLFNSKGPLWIEYNEKNVEIIKQFTSKSLVDYKQNGEDEY